MILTTFIQEIIYHKYVTLYQLNWANYIVGFNKLYLNIAKTNFMIFGNKQCEDNHVVSINGMNIKRVYVTTFLWVHIDSHLNWCEHINHIKSKISKKNVSIMRILCACAGAGYYSEFAPVNIHSKLHFRLNVIPFSSISNLYTACRSGGKKPFRFKFACKISKIFEIKYRYPRYSLCSIGAGNTGNYAHD